MISSDIKEEHLVSTSTSDRWRWLAFAAALAATLMDLLDSTIANVAAPAIRADLGGSYADLQWIAAAYTLAMAVDAAHRRPARRHVRAQAHAARRRGRLHARVGRVCAPRPRSRR